MERDFLAEMQLLGRDQPIITFVLGSPGTETLISCNEMMIKASRRLLNQNANVNAFLNYGVPGGDKQVLQQIAEFLSEQYGDAINSSDLMITAGATQGLHLLLSILCQHSGPVFIEDPSYFFGIRMIRDDLQMNLVTVPCDNEGMNADALDKLLTEYKSLAKPVISGTRYWAAVYLVSVFSNPTGKVFSEDYCKKLIQVARKHDILLITEDVYNLLYYKNISHAPPRLLSYDKKTDPDYGRGHVISNGTFSKFLVPSLRLGWIEGPTQIISTLIKSNLANSGGCFNHYNSLLVKDILRSGALVDHLKFLRKTYKRRMDTLCSILDKLPEECSYQKPEGGFFLWLHLRPDIDASEFLSVAVKTHDVSFLPGVSSSSTGSFKNCVRLSISANSEEIISEGAKRFCRAYQEYTSSL